ncbi:MAG TPA: LicD family protein [Myxococcota bacterium]|nr:LicD family protein [Myxococcota bacterium]
MTPFHSARPAALPRTPPSPPRLAATHPEATLTDAVIHSGPALALAPAVAFVPVPASPAATAASPAAQPSVAPLTDAVLTRTPQAVVDAVYEGLACLDRLLRAADVNYTLFGGSVLGTVRHGGLIPWDDDADIAIPVADVPKVRELGATLLAAGFELTENYFGLRISPVDGAPRGDGIKVPFIDIFALDDYGYISEQARSYWPQRPLPRGAFERLRDVRFGHLTLRSLGDADAVQHLDDNYGGNWQTVAYKEWDHLQTCEVQRVRVRIVDYTCARHSKDASV